MIDLLENALAVNENICVFCERCAIVLDGNQPLSSVFLPNRLDHSVIELHIAVKVPFLRPLFEIFMNLWTRCVEVTPICFWVEWESLLD